MSASDAGRTRQVAEDRGLASGVQVDRRAALADPGPRQRHSAAFHAGPRSRTAGRGRVRHPCWRSGTPREGRRPVRRPHCRPARSCRGAPPSPPRSAARGSRPAASACSSARSTSGLARGRRPYRPFADPRRRRRRRRSRPRRRRGCVIAHHRRADDGSPFERVLEIRDGRSSQARPERDVGLVGVLRLEAGEPADGRRRPRPCARSRSPWRSSVARLRRRVESRSSVTTKGSRALGAPALAGHIF